MGKCCFRRIKPEKFATKLSVKSPYLSCFLPPFRFLYLLLFPLSPSGPAAASSLTNEVTGLKRPDTNESLNSSMSNGTTDAGKKGKHTIRTQIWYNSFPPLNLMLLQPYETCPVLLCLQTRLIATMTVMMTAKVSLWRSTRASSCIFSLKFVWAWTSLR